MQLKSKIQNEKLQLLKNFSSENEQINEYDIARDVSLIILRVGSAVLPSKVKWVDIFNQVQVQETKAQYRV